MPPTPDMTSATPRAENAGLQATTSSENTLLSVAVSPSMPALTALIRVMARDSLVVTSVGIRGPIPVLWRRQIPRSPRRYPYPHVVEDRVPVRIGARVGSRGSNREVGGQ